VAYNVAVCRTRCSWGLTAALLLASGCSDSDKYELALTPAEVSIGVAETFTIRVLTRLQNVTPVFLTEVVVSTEQAGIVSTLLSTDVAFDDEALAAMYDPGPPPFYSFKPRNPSDSYSIQTLKFRCLSTGQATIELAATWTGGDPEDEEVTVKTAEEILPVTCN